MAQNGLMDRVSDFDGKDVAGVTAYGAGGIASTAGIASLYGYDLTQSIGGISMLTGAIALMLVGIAIVFFTNSLEVEDITDWDTTESTGALLAAALPALAAWGPTFYTSRVGEPILGVLVIVGIAGLTILSSEGK